MDCYMQRRNRLYLITDSFNRANGNLGSADTGQAWLTGGSPTTAWVVASNLAKRASATTAVTDVAYIDCGRSNVTVSANITITSASNGAFLVARMSGSSLDDSMSAVFVQSANLVLIRKRIAGVNTDLASVSYTLTSGVSYACSFSCIGNDFSVSINGSVVASATNDNALKNNTRVGMFLPLPLSSANDYFDNFSVKG